MLKFIKIFPFSKVRFFLKKNKGAYTPPRGISLALGVYAPLYHRGDENRMMTRGFYLDDSGRIYTPITMIIKEVFVKLLSKS